MLSLVIRVKHSFKMISFGTKDTSDVLWNIHV